jgi:hypothetical protein
VWDFNKPAPRELPPDPTRPGYSAPSGPG